MISTSSAPLCCHIDEHMYAGFYDGTVVMWDNQGSILSSFKGHNKIVWSVESRGNELLICSDDKRTKLWDIESGACKQEFLGHSQAVNCAQFLQHDLIISCSDDSTIK